MPGERLQDHWSSGFKILLCFSAALIDVTVIRCIEFVLYIQYTLKARDMAR